MAVPVAVKAARNVTRALLAAGADRPETAQRLEGLSFPRRRALQRLVRDGVVREAGDGRYWLDGAAFDRWRATRLQRVMWVLLVVAAAMVALAVLEIVRQ
jgi:hypothetical protein